MLWPISHYINETFKRLHSTNHSVKSNTTPHHHLSTILQFVIHMRDNNHIDYTCLLRNIFYPTQLNTTYFKHLASLTTIFQIPTPLPLNTILATIHVTSLYINIPKNEGMQAAIGALSTLPSHTPRPPTPRPPL